MSRHRKRPVPPPGPATYIPGGVVEGENELTAGRPIPPFVELTPAGPRFGVVASSGGPAPGSPPDVGLAAPPVPPQGTQPARVQTDPSRPPPETARTSVR